MSGDHRLQVTVHSTLRGRASGDVSVYLNNEDTIDQAIIQFCIEKGIPYKSCYVLRNNRNILLDKFHRITTCEINDGDILYLGVKDTEKTFGCSNWWILATVVLIIGGIGVVAVSLMYSFNNNQVIDFGIIFDAGSTKTDMFVYQWDGEKLNNTGVVKQVALQRCSDDGAATLIDNLPKLREDLHKCLNLAKNTVSPTQFSKSPVYLGATAGMRLLEKKNRTQSDIIMKEIRKVMSSSGFLFADEQARIITGEEEGIGSWITVNFFKGSLEKMSLDAEGALDLGGASTQITFEPREAVSDVEILRLYGRNHTVYSHSFLCYGKSEAERRMLANLVKKQNSSTVSCACCPLNKTFTWSSSDLLEQVCTSSSFAVKAWRSTIDSNLKNEMYTFEGESNSEKCQLQVSDLFNTTCNKSHCSFGNVYQPIISGDFVAFSGYSIVANFFNVTVNTTRNEFTKKVKDFCAKSWEQINGTVVRNETDLYYYCFDGIYILKILELYGFNTSDFWQKLSFTSTVDNQKIGWTLGFMLNATNTLPVDKPAEFISLLTFIVLIILFILCIVLAVIIACYARSQYKGSLGFKTNSEYGAIE